MKITDHAGGVITEPGFYRMRAPQYHVDPCATPSLSNSIAKLCVHRAPRHAWLAHPRLNPDYEPKAVDRTAEIGSVAHKIFLGTGAAVVVIPFDDYKKGDAKKLRADAYAANKLPILEPDLVDAQAMAKVAREEFMKYPAIAPTIEEGVSEIVSVWKERLDGLDEPIVCRSMSDRLALDLRVVLDYKTTTNAHPDACAARIGDNDFQMQDPFYERGLNTLDPDGMGRRQFFFLYQEQTLPYACTVHQLDGENRGTGERQVREALGVWGECLARGVGRECWPMYERIVHRVGLKPWKAEQWLRHESERDERRIAIGKMLPIAKDYFYGG